MQVSQIFSTTFLPLSMAYQTSPSVQLGSKAFAPITKMALKASVENARGPTKRNYSMLVAIKVSSSHCALQPVRPARTMLN